MSSAQRCGFGARTTPVDVAVVTPVYRNRATLPSLYARVGSVLDQLGKSWNLVFVNDVCPQRSIEVMRALAQDDPRVVIVDLDQNVGQARAVLEGLRHVRARYVVIMDADLQDPPEAIAKLLVALDANGPRCKVVFAGHRGRYEPWLRWVTGRVFRTLRGWLFGIPRDAGSFGIICGDALPALLSLSAPLPHWPLLVGWLKLPSRSVPVRRHQRHQGESAYSHRKRLRVAAETFRTW